MAKKIENQHQISRKVVYRHAETKIPVLRIIVIWSVYFISLIGVFLWLRKENTNIMVLYQQSELCDSHTQTQYQENCYENIAVTVNQVFYIYGGQSPNRYGGAPSGNNEVIQVDLDLTMPDGDIVKTSISKQESYQRQDGKNNYWILLSQVDYIQKGDILTVSRWRGKIISIKVNQSQFIYTMDHPENIAKNLYARVGGIFSLLFIVLLAWSIYEFIRKRN
jgi:hypothetical protein